MAEKGVRFVRIHGRVVPIREKNDLGRKEKNTKVEGAALITTGVAVGLGAGALSARAHREAAIHENVHLNYKRKLKDILKNGGLNGGAKPEGSGPRLRKQYGQFVNQAVKNKAEAMRFDQAGKVIKNTGLGVSAALVAIGTNKLIPEKTKKEHKVVTTAVSGASGLGAAFLIRSAYYKSSHMGNMKTWGAVKLAAKRVVARGIKM